MRTPDDSPRFGVALQGVDPPAEFLSLVRDIEDWGFDQLWLTDSSLHARYVYAYLALAANQTRRISIGTSVTNPLTRHPAISAMAIATIDEISGGRAILGIGAGDRPLNALGLEPASITTLRDSVHIARRLFRGEEVTFSSDGIRLNAAQFHVSSRENIRIFVGASGPKTLQLAGEIADGVIVLAGLFPEGIEYALGHIRKGSARAERPEPEVAGFMYGSLRNDPQIAIEEARPIAAWFCQTAPRYCRLAGMPDEICESVRGSYRGGEFQEALHAAQRIPDHMVKKVALAGTPEEGRRKVQMLLDAGIRSIVLFPLGSDRRSVIRAFAESIIPHFRQESSLRWSDSVSPKGGNK